MRVYHGIINKNRLLVGHFHKLIPRNYDHFQVMRKINNNSYVINSPNEWQISSIFNNTNIYTYFSHKETVVIEMNLEIKEENDYIVVVN